MDIREIIREIVRKELNEAEHEPMPPIPKKPLGLGPSHRWAPKPKPEFQRNVDTDKLVKITPPPPNVYTEDLQEDGEDEVLTKLRETTVYKNKCN
jgi:hypothetical protein